MSDRFPVLNSGGAEIPWSLIAPHEAQAQKNHDQSLSRLAARGGLSWCEMAAVLDDRSWRAMPDGDSFAAVLSRLVENELQQRAAQQKPIIDHFVAGVAAEAEHQRVRWGEAHDRNKSAEDWFWLIGYLAGKALRASIEGDRDKALHHTISAAAALSQWHAAILGDEPRGNPR